MGIASGTIPENLTLTRQVVGKECEVGVATLLLVAQCVIVYASDTMMVEGME
jgi:hypothetical protein